jgi:hypothetical protein
LSAPLRFLERSKEAGSGFGIAARSGSDALFVSILIISDCMNEHGPLNTTMRLLALGILSKIKGVHLIRINQEHRARFC